MADPLLPGWGSSAISARLKKREDKGRRAGNAADAELNEKSWSFWHLKHEHSPFEC